jgi:hypothetical protein
MGSADRTGDRRLGWEATPQAITRERVAGFVLLCLFLGLALLLVGACNMQGFPPPPPGGGPGGGGGQKQQGYGGGVILIGPGGAAGDFGPGGPYGGAPGGPGGAGGGDGNTDCLSGSFACVPSCAVSSPPYTSGSCDHYGSLTCPTGSLRLASCAPNACARPPTFSCCDLTSGAITQPPCGLDGLVAGCPAGTFAERLYTCIPPSLGVTDCNTLDRQPCSMVDQRCQSAGEGPCQCTAQDAGLIWRCTGFGDPAP